MYITREFVFLSNFLYVSSIVSLFELITIIDKIYHGDAANDVTTFKLLMLVFVLRSSLLVSFSNKFIIRLVFLNLFLTIISYVELMAILSAIRLVIRSRYMCIDEECVSICRVERVVAL